VIVSVTDLMTKDARDPLALDELPLTDRPELFRDESWRPVCQTFR
jgi:hypothetical protein